MMPVSSRIQSHNTVQRAYYAGDVWRNPRMRPASSNYVHRLADRLTRFGGLSTSERVLEVGCGMGKFTLPLLERGYALEGIDLSADLLAQLRTYLPAGRTVQLHCGDALDPPSEMQGRWDAVIGFFTLHHLVDLRTAFRALGTYLRPGGRLIFLEPNAYNPLFYLQITLTPGMRWRAEKGLLRMTRRQLVAALHDTGFHDIQCERFGMLPPAVMNRSFGPRLEDAIGRLAIIRPVAAFQLVRATVPLGQRASGRGNRPALP
jgi:SAM-dependent methyltransferase